MILLPEAELDTAGSHPSQQTKEVSRGASGCPNVHQQVTKEPFADAPGNGGHPFVQPAMLMKHLQVIGHGKVLLRVDNQGSSIQVEEP